MGQLILLKSKIFNLFTFSIIFFLFLLGTWQLKRLEWKNNLIEKVTKSYDQKSIAFNGSSKLFSKVIINGQIINQPIFVYNLGEKGEYGYDLYMPIKTEEKIILVRAGWTPRVFKLNNIDSKKSVIIEGILLNPKRKNIFTPDNSSELTFYLDIKNLNLKFDHNLFPMIAESRTNFLQDYNLKVPGKIKLPNNHLQYALTWYSLCFVLIITFLIYKRKI